MTHLSDWIIPHLNDGVEIHHFVVPNPRNPTLLGQETPLHGVPAPEDTHRRIALLDDSDAPVEEQGIQ